MRLSEGLPTCHFFPLFFFISLWDITVLFLATYAILIRMSSEFGAWVLQLLDYE